MKKILFITNMEGMWPFSQMLVDFFRGKGDKIFILDVGKHIFIDDNQRVTQIDNLSSAIPSGNKYYRFIKRKTELFFLKKFFKKTDDKFDITILLYLLPTYSYLANSIRQITEKLILMYAGSDFYRASISKRLKDKTILDKVDGIFFGNPGMLQDFKKFYNDYDEKCHVQYIGSVILDEIAKISQSKTQLKKKYGLSSGICITIGYSGAQTQQHDKILNSIIESIQNKNIALLFPTTQGVSNSGYIESLKSLLADKDIKHHWFEKKLTNAEIAEIRSISDITINMQTTDMASASLVEYIATGNIMLIADWLTYDFWDELSFKYIKVNFGNLDVHLKHVLHNFEKYQIEAYENKIKAMRNLAWSVTRINLYNKINRI